METFLMYFFGVVAFGLVIYLLIKKADIKTTLFGVGILLLYVAILMGNQVTKTGYPILAPLQVVVDAFKSILPKAGLIILILGGYTRYMNVIGANEVTVYTLTKPLKGITSPWVLVPFVFLIGNFLSLVIPSASNLAIILLATLYPVLKRAGMSTLTAAGVIATTATIMPTPLGADNVAIAEELAKHAEFAGLTTTKYVYGYHAPVSIPTLLLMAVVHYFWQKYMDQRQVKKGISVIENDIDTSKAVNIEGGTLYKVVYTILPLLPIILLLLFYLLGAIGGPSIDLSVELAVLISFAIAIFSELFRKRDGKKVMKDIETFFDGMASMFGVVALLTAATVFVNGLQAIGLIKGLESIMQNTSAPGFVLPLILVLLTGLVVILSGSGTALFYAMVPLMYNLASVAGISPFAVSIPMGLAGNLLRAVSPVSAVVVIVAGATNQNPIEIVKRTSVPMIAGVIFMFILSMIMFL
ncbi:MAG TPA: C4-dicarboxylate transporter DcuC [Clostridia bacterium]|nr:C4-dicarboxylate transporter DcuC [Clostridia bacterium]